MLILLVVIIAVVAVVANSNSGTTGSSTSATSQPTDTYSSSGGFGSGDNTVTDAFNGVWSGTVSKTDGSKDRARITLFSGLSTGLVTYTSDTSGTIICTGTLHVESASDSKIVLKENILTNTDKCTNGYDTLYSDSSGSLRYEWRLTQDGSLDWTGTLTKN